MQADPIVPDPGNPQDLNRYSYVRNNPLRYTDPTGHRECDWACPDDWIDWQIQFGAAYQGEWDVAKQRARQETAAKVLGTVFALVPGPDAGDDALTFLTGCGYACQLGGEGPVGWGWRAVSGAAFFVPVSGSVLRHGGADELLEAAKSVGRIDPSKVRFSQSSISYRFKDEAMGTIDDLAEGLRSGRIDPSDVPPIRVVEINGQLFTLDNRRLEAFRRAGVDIPYRYATPEELAREGWKFTTTNEGITIIVRGEP